MISNSNYKKDATEMYDLKTAQYYGKKSLDYSKSPFINLNNPYETLTRVLYYNNTKKLTIMMCINSELSNDELIELQKEFAPYMEQKFRYKDSFCILSTMKTDDKLYKIMIQTVTVIKFLDLSLKSFIKTYTINSNEPCYNYKDNFEKMGNYYTVKTFNWYNDRENITHFAYYLPNKTNNVLKIFLKISDNDYDQIPYLNMIKQTLYEINKTYKNTLNIANTINIINNYINKEQLLQLYYSLNCKATYFYKLKVNYEDIKIKYAFTMLKNYTNQQPTVLLLNDQIID